TSLENTRLERIRQISARSAQGLLVLFDGAGRYRLAIDDRSKVRLAKQKLFQRRGDPRDIPRADPVGLPAVADGTGPEKVYRFGRTVVGVAAIGLRCLYLQSVSGDRRLDERGKALALVGDDADDHHVHPFGPHLGVGNFRPSPPDDL